MQPWEPQPEQPCTGAVPARPSWDPPAGTGPTAAPAVPAAPQWTPGSPAAPAWQAAAPAFHPAAPASQPAAPAWQPTDPAWQPQAARQPSAAAPGPAALRDSFGAGAAGAGAALLTAFAASGVIAALVSDSPLGRAGASFPVARFGAWLYGLAFGAPLTFAAGGSSSSYGSGSFGVNIHLPVPLILLVACVVTAALTVRSQRARPVLEPAAVLVASAGAAVVPAVVGLVTALASGTSGSSTAEIFSGGAQVGVSPFPAVAYPALIVFAVSALARFAAGGVRVPSGLVQAGVGPSLRAVGDYLLLTAALASVVVLAVALTASATVGAVLGGWLLLFPGIGVLGAQLAAFAPLEVSGSGNGSLGGVGSLLSGAGLSDGSRSAGGSQSVFLFGGQAPGWTWALLLIPVVGVVIAGVRYTLRRPPTATPPLAGAAVTGLLLTAVLFLLDLYLRVGASASGRASTSLLGGASGSGAGGVGIGPLGYLSALVVGALIPLAGWLLTPALYRGAPGLLRSTASLPVRSRSVLAVLPALPGGHPGAPAGGGTGGAGALGLGLVLLLLASGGGVAAGRSLTGDSTASQDTALADVPQDTYTPPTEAAPSYDDPATDTPSYTPDPTPTPPAAPTVSPGGIDLSAVADDAVTPQVASTLDNYFGAINRHDGAAAVANFDPSGAVNPNDSSQVAQFQRDTSTSSDDQVVIHAIEPDPENAGGYLVSVSFRSQQAPSFGPGGNEACTNWDLSYHMTPQFKLLRSSGASHSAC